VISQVAALRAFAESGEDAPAVQFPPIENVIEWPAFFGDGQFWAFNKISLICLIALAVPTILFLMAGRGSAENPSKLRVIAEGIIGFVEEQIAKPGIGHGYEPYVPLLTAFFMFIAIGNLFEVIPFFQMPMNARMGPPLVLALIAWAMFMAVGLKHNGFSYITGVVWPKSIENPAMRAFVGFIEFFSTFIVRPFSHAVRLFANMLAGHILLITFNGVRGRRQLHSGLRVRHSRCRVHRHVAPPGALIPGSPLTGSVPDRGVTVAPNSKQYQSHYQVIHQGDQANESCRSSSRSRSGTHRR